MSLGRSVALALLLLASPTSAWAETLSSKVVGITDGDTLTVLVERREVKVRLADTRERGQPWASGQAVAVGEATAQPPR